MRPSLIDTSPSTMSKRSFIVTTIPPRIKRDDTAIAGCGLRIADCDCGFWTSDFACRWRLRTSDFGFRVRELRRRPPHRGRVLLAVLHRDQLREDADGDLLR